VRVVLGHESGPSLGILYLLCTSHVLGPKTPFPPPPRLIFRVACRCCWCGWRWGRALCRARARPCVHRGGGQRHQLANPERGRTDQDPDRQGAGWAQVRAATTRCCARKSPRAGLMYTSPLPCCVPPTLSPHLLVHPGSALAGSWRASCLTPAPPMRQRRYHVCVLRSAAARCRRQKRL
jgi:hypothetical protein